MLEEYDQTQCFVCYSLKCSCHLKNKPPSDMKFRKEDLDTWVKTNACKEEAEKKKKKKQVKKYQNDCNVSTVNAFFNAFQSPFASIKQ